MRNRQVIDEGILAGLGELDWERTGFALAAGYDEKTGRFDDLYMPSSGSMRQVTDRTLVVRPDLAQAQYDADKANVVYSAEQEKQTGTTPPDGSGGTSTVDPGSTTTSGSSTPAEPPKKVRFFGSAKLNPELPQKSFTKIYQELVQHLSAVDGTELELTLEISAKNEKGFPEDKIRIVSENARVLKFDPFGFEDS
jgi:hypothetical protein